MSTRIPIDVDAAERYLSTNPRVDLQEYLATHVRDGHARLCYRFCETGQKLVDAKLIVGARVYATGDPFLLCSELNELLTSRLAHNLDDRAAYPTYLRALTKDEDALRLLDELPAVRGELDEHYGCATKELVLRMMMDGGAEAWKAERGCQALVDHPFVLQFQSAMRRVTDELCRGERAAAALAIIGRKRKRSSDPRLTWKAFLLQEVEYKVRQAKLRVAGRYATQQEHDGVKVLVDCGQSAEELAAQMSVAASAAIGVAVQVEVKPPREFDLPDKRAPPWLTTLIETGITHQLVSSIIADDYALQRRCAYAGVGKDPWRVCRGGVWTSGEPSQCAREEVMQLMVAAVLAQVRAHAERLAVHVKGESRLTQATRLIADTHFQTAALQQCRVSLMDCAFDETLDSKLHIVAFNDGRCLERGVGFRPLAPDDRVSKTVGYGSDAVERVSDEQISAVRAYLESHFVDPAVAQYLLVVFAAALWGVPYEEFWLFAGSGGNGKTMLVSFLREVFGGYFAELNHTVLTKPLAGGEGASPFIAALRGARLVNTAEPGECDQIEAQQLKRMAGQERLVARRLYGTPEYIPVTYKLIMSANDPPDLSSAGESVQRRFRLVNFDVTFCDNPSGAHQRQASDAINDVWRKHHAPALLWMIAQQELPATRNIPAPPTVVEASKQHVDNALADLRLFIDSRCSLVDKHEATTMMAFREAAMAFLKHQRRRKISLAAFKNAMAQLGYEETNESVDGRHIRAWRSTAGRYLGLGQLGW